MSVSRCEVDGADCPRGAALLARMTDRRRAARSRTTAAVLQAPLRRIAPPSVSLAALRRPILRCTARSISALPIRRSAFRTARPACAWSSSRPGYSTMPTAVFYAVEGPAAQPAREFGRAAVAAYVDGIDGRLMRSMKSILGSTLIDQTTDVGGGRAVKYLDVVTGYLQRLKTCAEAAAGAPIDARGARPAGLLRRRRSGARRVGAARARSGRAPGRRSRTSASSTSRSRRRSTTSAASRPSRSCWSPTSAAARPTSRSSGSDRAAPPRSIARPTSSPTTASTSPGPTSTGASSSPASCPSSATARSVRRRPAHRRAKCRARSTSTSRPGT